MKIIAWEIFFLFFCSFIIFAFFYKFAYFRKIRFAFFLTAVIKNIQQACKFFPLRGGKRL